MSEENESNEGNGPEVKKRNRLIDVAVVVVGVVVVAFLSSAPEETTKRMPKDDTHAKYFEIFAKEGKKAAGKHCEECHNEDGVQFPKDHPPKYRCLFCHKLEK